MTDHASPTTDDRIRAALEEACGACACSLRERDSGHLTGCPVPGWRALLDESEPEPVADQRILTPEYLDHIYSGIQYTSVRNALRGHIEALTARLAPEPCAEGDRPYRVGDRVFLLHPGPMTPADGWEVEKLPLNQLYVLKHPNGSAICLTRFDFSPTKVEPS